MTLPPLESVVSAGSQLMSSILICTQIATYHKLKLARETKIISLKSVVKYKISWRQQAAHVLSTPYLLSTFSPVYCLKQYVSHILIYSTNLQIHSN